MEIVSRHGTTGSRQSWHDRALVRGDRALDTHTTRLGRALDKALCARLGLSRQEISTRQGFSVAIEISLS